MFRRALLAASLFAICVGAITWFSGPDGFDYVDGNEFVICGRELGTPHPPGYPLFIFVLRVGSEVFPGSTVDYDFFRMISSVIAAAGYIAAVAVMMSFGAGVIPSLLGSFLFFVSGPVLGQLNIVEIHGFGILLALLAILFRDSRAGPYFFSLSVFGGHPMSILLLPVVLTKRFRERWALLALIPPTLLLFVPLRSMFPALAHYAYPSSLHELRQYFMLYSSYFTGLSNRLVDAVTGSMGLFPAGIMVCLAAASLRMRWRLLTSIAVGVFFLSVYGISDTDSLLWLVLLPLSIWATSGIDRISGAGKVAMLLAVVLVGISAGIGMRGAWKSGDNSASVISRDRLRGIESEAVLVSVGFDTFCTAYLMEVEDRRPDIITMDETECYFRVRPPENITDFMGDRRVYMSHGWTQELLVPCGILFSTPEDSVVDWDLFDLFWMTDDVADPNSRIIMAEIWVLRGAQTEDTELQAVIWSVAQNWAGESGLAHINQRIAPFLPPEDETVLELVTTGLLAPFETESGDSTGSGDGLDTTVTDTTVTAGV